MVVGVVGTLGRLNPRRHFYVCVSGLHCTERDESVRLAWFVSGWQVPLFSDRNNLLHNLQTQHFVRGKGWQEMRWPYGGMVGPENGMLVDRGKGWPGIRAWMNVRVECGSHGNGEMEMGSKMVQFQWLHIYKHNKGLRSNLYTLSTILCKV